MAYTPVSALSAVTIALNTWYKVSDYRTAVCHYNIIISATASTLAGSSVRIFLEDSLDGITANLIHDGAEVGITAGVLMPVITTTVKLSGTVPLGNFVRIRTQIIAGSSTFGSVGTPSTNTAYGTELLIG